MLSEAQEQVTANLANFAYDPINFEYLREALAIELFLELLANVNPKLVRHGIAGICNICLGTFPANVVSTTEMLIKKHFVSEAQSRSQILSLGGIEKIASLLPHECDDIVQKALATLIQLDSADIHLQIFTEANVTSAKKHLESAFIPLKNIAAVFLEQK